MNEMVLAVDLGGTNLRMAAVDHEGAVLHLERSPTPDGVRPDRLMEILAAMADKCIDNVPGNRRLAGFGAGVPANITPEGVLKNLPNVPSLEGMDLKRSLTARFNVPTVLENDATAAAIGENWLGASRAVRDSILITLGTGVGGGIILDGQPLRGIDGTAGKIGHICVEPKGVPCDCGGRGCIEQYASATAVVRMATQAGLDAATSLEVYRAARGGDERARRVFQTVGYYLGIVIAGLLNTLNPEMVVVGGGAAAAWDLFIDPLTYEMTERAFSEPVNRVRVVRSELGDNAGILGAGRSAFVDRGN